MSNNMYINVEQDGEPMEPGQDCDGGGYSYGPRAEDTEFEDIPITEWQR